MKIIAISTDATIFDRNSTARGRMEEYSRLFDEYYIVVYTPPGFQVSYAPPLFLYPTNSHFFWLRPYDAYRIAKSILKRHGGDLVSVQDPAETGIVGWLVKRRFSIPLHIQVHTDFFSPFFRKHSWREYVRYLIALFLIPRADSIRAVSRRIAQSLNSEFRVQSSKITTLPIFVDRIRITEVTPVFELKKKYPQFSFIFLMVSRLTREKNIPLAIRAFKDFLRKVPSAGLVIVGDGPERKNLELRIQDSGLSKNVLLAGWQDDLISYYRGADLYLLTSNFEGYGRTVVEAAAAGCPVIMTNVGVGGEVIRNRETGLVVPVGDLSALGGSLLWAREHQTEMKDMAARAQKEVFGSHPQTRREYLEMYRQSLEFKS